MSDRSARLAPLWGVVFAVLLVVGVLLGSNSLHNDSSTAKVISYYAAHHSRESLGAYLVGLSVVAGLFFFGYLRRVLGESAATARLAATGLVGVAVFGVGGGIEAGANWALADIPHQLTPGAAQALNLITTDLAAFVFLPGLAVLLIAFGVCVVRSALLPRWLGFTAAFFGVVALTPAGWASLFAVGIWSLIAGAMLYMRAPLARDATGAPTPPPAVAVS